MRGRTGPALEDAETAIALNPSFATALMVRADARMMAGYPESALEDVAAVRTLAPLDPYVHTQLAPVTALSYLRMGDYAESARQAQFGVEVHANPTWCSATLAVALFALGETRRALAVGRGLVDRRPGFALRTLDQLQLLAPRDEHWAWFLETLGRCGVPE